MLELSNRIRAEKQGIENQILSSHQIAKLMMHELGDKKQEHLVALYLDTQNRIIEEKQFLSAVLDAQLLNQEKFYTMLVKIWLQVSL